MPAAPASTVAQPLTARRSWDGGAVGARVLGVAAVLYLGLRGGGYDSVVRGEAGVAVWWVVLAGCAAGVLPARRVDRLAWLAIGLLAAFAAWSALSASWSESGERSIASAGMVAMYLGALVLGAFAVRRGTTRHLVHGVAVAVAVLGLVALLSRLEPTWFPADRTAEFLPSARGRLSYPVNYWNGLAALMAIGLPLLFVIAVKARSLTAQAAAAGAIPVLALTLSLTISRGGTAAVIVGLLVAVAAGRPFATGLVTILVTGAGSLLLILAADQRDALQQAAGSPLARHEGGEMVAYVIVVALGVACVRAGLALFSRTTSFTVPARATRRLAGAAGVAAIVVFLALGGAGVLSNAWSDFKNPQVAGNTTSARFSSVSGNGRYQYWSSAADAWSAHPIAGIGAGSWELWWARNADLPGHVVNAHSLYMETLAETGLVGLALLAVFLAALLLAAFRRARGGDPLAAGAAGAIAAFIVMAASDWVWQIPVIPVAVLLLGGAMLAGGTAPAPGRSRVLTGGLAFGALALVLVPMASTAAVRRSQENAQDARLGPALQQALAAGRVQPYAGTPLVQRALVLEQAGDLDAARLAAAEAERREPTNWQPAFVRARIEAERGDVAAAVEAFRRARSLNKTASFLRP